MGHSIDNIKNMAKEIRIILEEDEYNKLVDFKKGNNWRSLLTYHIKKTREETIQDKYYTFVKEMYPYLNNKEQQLIEVLRVVFIQYMRKQLKKEDILELSNRLINSINEI